MRYAASQPIDENRCALCVWLDNGGRQGLNTLGFQQTIYLIMHGTFLALMEAYSASTFQFTGKAKPLKYMGKMRCKSVEK